MLYRHIQLKTESNEIHEEANFYLFYKNKVKYDSGLKRGNTGVRDSLVARAIKEFKEEKGKEEPAKEEKKEGKGEGKEGEGKEGEGEEKKEEEVEDKREERS